MATTNIMVTHIKERSTLRRAQRGEWYQLLNDQEKSLMEKEDTTGLAATFQKEREEYNKRFAREKAALVEKQQKELEEYKAEKGKDKSEEFER